MRKIGYILIAVILVSGCSVERRHKRSIGIANAGKEGVDIRERLVSQNITLGSFYVEKAEFRVIGGDDEKRGIATVKFVMPDKFLVSIKSIGGIEFARIYLEGDSIQINDRMDKKLYYGSASYVKRKYGLTTAVLPVILGDYINEDTADSTRVKCREGNFSVKGKVRKLIVNYIVDCKLGKIIQAIPGESGMDSGLMFSYSDFFQVNGINIPGRIEVSDKLKNTRIEIKILKLSIPLEGTIDFIPGRQYEKIPLL